MRGTRAKALRRANPLRPNPGRKGGGLTKMMSHLSSKVRKINDDNYKA